MFLTSLTLEGFKSFADRTRLGIEPGVTVIVGPNGSGKSNVVDALAWVLGTNSPKRVRGGHMTDVIFAGSPTRTSSGRAGVEITIDNSRGQLGAAGVGASRSAQEFAEVKVARTVDRDGQATYLVNGEEVRSLDVQELLSDTGLGRELHTVIGQGELDDILNARPEERRAWVEEAAGILKHRRRRERARRKLEQVDAHSDKLHSVVRELRRQLQPLQRQAEAADRHAQLQAQLRDVQLQIAAAELARLSAHRDADVDADRAAVTRQRAAEATAVELRAREASLTADAERLRTRAAAAQSTYYRLTSLGERLRGTGDLIEARRRHLVEYVDEPLAGRAPTELRQHADRLDHDREELATAAQHARNAFDAAVAARREAEQGRRAREVMRQAEARRRAEQRERTLRWEGEVSALRGAVATAEAEAGRIASQLTSLDARITEAESELIKVEDEIQQLDAGEVELTAALDAAERNVTGRQEAADVLAARVRDLDSRRMAHAARAEALRTAAAERDAGATALLAAGLAGIVGPLAGHLRIDPAMRTAVAAALGPLGGAVVAASGDDAGHAVQWLHDHAAGAAVLLAASDPGTPGGLATRDLDAGSGGAGDTLSAAEVTRLRAAGVTPIADHLAPAGDDATATAVVATLRAMLAGTFVVSSWHDAVRLHSARPRCTFVTADGDVTGPRGYSGGHGRDDGAVAAAAAAADAERRAARLADELERARTALARRERELAAAHAELTAVTDRLNASDARIAGAAERVARLNRELVGLANQRDMVAGQQAELAAVIGRDRADLAQLNGRGPAAADAAGEDLGSGHDPELERLDTRVEEVHEQELEARVRLERIAEQARHVELQAADLRREADEVEAALTAAARRREQRRHGLERCGELSLVCRAAIAALDRSIDSSAGVHGDLRAELEQAGRQLDELRARIRQADAEVAAAREACHAADLRRSELDHRLAALAARLRDDLDVSPEDVAAAHPDAAGYDRDQLVEREDVLHRKLGLLGRVNPLALEELRALEERHSFLAGQLDDLRRSKRDLEQVIVQVDDRIRAVFAGAFADVAAQFEVIFATLFPGGAGRLTLTDADDLLTAGIEVEARPPGKRVTRLSLLSGGERSLTVLAFVFAIFKARPSPFYVLDEVDAALDDVNLQRLLAVVESFRGHAQVILVTHQQRSMEIADVLYGVTMGSDAVSRVVADHPREQADPEPEPAQLTA